MSDRPPSPLSVTCSPGFADWLTDRGVALAITTYQAGRLLLIGVNQRGKLVVHQRAFPRPMGAWSDGRQLWLATRHQMWQLIDVMDTASEQEAPSERLYLPKVAHTIGDVDTHDIALDADGRVLMVSTLMNCLAQLDEGGSFRPVWGPSWIDDWVAEDRAHVNGLALVEGQPRYCSVCGETNTRKGWKTNRETGGAIVDITNDEVVARGLSMPHSPRWHAGRLWVLNSGCGELGHIDSRGQFTPVAFCPGYLRGLDFIDRWALVGLSRPRHKTFSGLALDDQLARRGLEPRTGVMLVDYRTGEIEQWLLIEGPIVELYDVVVLPKTTRARSLSLKNDDLEKNIWLATDDAPPRRFTSRRRRRDQNSR